MTKKISSRPRTFFIIPGFKQKSNDKHFMWLERFLKGKGFVVVKVSIIWDRKTMSDYAKEFIKAYEENKSKTNYVLGFSYGAVIAFLTANTLKPNKIYLCSLSPDFKEDIGAMNSQIKKLIGKKRLANAQENNARQIAKSLKVPSAIFYGEAEGKQYPQLKIRCEETAKLARHSNLVVVENSPHKIDNPAYQTAIKAELNQL